MLAGLCVQLKPSLSCLNWKIMFVHKHIPEARREVFQFYPLGGAPVSKAVIV